MHGCFGWRLFLARGCESPVFRTPKEVLYRIPLHHRGMKSHALDKRIYTLRGRKLDQGVFELVRKSGRPSFARLRRMRAARTISLGLTSVIALVLPSYLLLGVALLSPAASAGRPPSNKPSNRDNSHSPWIGCKVSPRARTLGDFRCPTLSAASSPHEQHQHAGAAPHAGGAHAGGHHGGAASPPPGGAHGGAAAWSRHYVESVLALRHAPLLYHHPLERHFLTDPVKVRGEGETGEGVEGGEGLQAKA